MTRISNGTLRDMANYDAEYLLDIRLYYFAESVPSHMLGGPSLSFLPDGIPRSCD